MCDTMTNNAATEDTSYVLTEDMIDAAMTQQFGFRDDEGEEEFTSPDYSMDLDVDAQVTIIPERTTRSASPLNDVQGQNSTDSIKTTTLEGPTNKVFIIETGLDKSNEILLENTETENLSSTHIPDQSSNKAEVATIADSPENITALNQTRLSYDAGPSYENLSTTKEPILTNILNRSANREPIDLCNSDTDEVSDEEINEVETVDNELQSEMESNFMAELGLTANNKISNSVGQFTKLQDAVNSPKLQVKNVTRISSSAFNSMPQSNQLSGTHNVEFPIVNNTSGMISKTKETSLLKGFQVPNFVVKPKDHTIHLNKIAVPNQTYINSQGEKIKCVYFENSMGAPVVINSSQQASTSKDNVTHMMTQQMQRPTRLSPTELISNTQKRQLQFNQLPLPVKQSVMPVNQSVTSQSNFPTNHPVVSNHSPNVFNYQPKHTKPNILSNAPRIVKTVPLRLPGVPPSRQKDERDNTLVKSLLFHNLKPPYNPELDRKVTIFECSDCHDRFVIQSSLTHHLARRSLLIRYWCHACAGELHFFNRCVFLGHLRSHNYPISHLDYSKISVSPLSIEMINGGVVSSFFKESPNYSDLPYEESILSKTRRDAFETSEQVNSSVNKSLTPKGNNNFNQNTLIATSQPTNTQSPISLLRNKVNTLRFTCTSSTREISMPVCLPKNPVVPSVQNVRNPVVTSVQNVRNPVVPSVQNVRAYRKEPPNDNTKSVPKKIVLVLDKQNKPHKVTTQNAKINVLPPNELFSVSDNMIIDDDSSEKPKESVEEELMIVESETVTNGPQTTGSSPFNSSSTSTSNKTVKQTRGPALPSKSNPEKSLKKVCSECGVRCLNIGRHLNGGGRPNNPLLLCKTCDLILPTTCAFKCHLRIHDKLQPYKCPDCGKDFTRWDDLYSHLKMSCGHFAKCVRYYCLTCKKHFASKSSLANHISTLHTRDVFRCFSCPVAFYNKASLDKHLATSDHKDEIVRFVPQKQCKMCPTKVMPLVDVPAHVEAHANNHAALIYGYRCPQCAMVFVNKMAFIIHQVEEKKGKEDSKNKVKKKNVFELLSQDSELNGLGSNKKENSQSDFEFVEQFPNFEVNLPAAEKDPLSSDDWEFLLDQKVKDKREEVCIVCKKNSVVLLPGLNANQQSLCCKQCVKTLDIQSTVQNGQTKSNIMDRKSISNSKINLGETTQRPKKNFSRGKRLYSGDKTQNRPSKQTKNMVLHNQAGSVMESNMESNSDSFIPVKKIKKKTNQTKIDFGGKSSYHQGRIITFHPPNELVCAKCRFVADTKETFLEHITVHRIDPNTYQCLECGICFVALPSLERHLLMNHGIQDVNEYTNKNKTSLPKKIYEEETRCLQENQCRVCFETYDSNSSLEKHFRTHGMAFMTSLSKSP